MDSFHRLQPSKQHFESPAKVFAKMKSRVNRGNDVPEKHGAVFKSPWKKAPSTWMHDELRANQKPAFYRDEALALTLSPPSSPKNQTLCCSDTFNEMGHGGIPRKRAFLESTTISSVDNHTQPPGHTRSPDRLLSPMRLRKRKLPSLDFDRVSSCPTGGTSEPTNSTSSVFTEDFGGMRAFSAGLPERNRFTFEPGFPSPSSSTRTHDTLEKLHVMSPAKMFNLMKQRESRAKQQDVVRKVCTDKVDLIDPGHLHLTRDLSPPSTAHTSETEDGSVSQLPGGRYANLQSSPDSSEDFPGAAMMPPPQQPVLQIDPVVLKTPQISIPKKQEAMFKRNKHSQIMKFPSESVIHLRKWSLRKNRKGLYVDGIHQHDDIPWNSNIITERISNKVLKTVSGRVYILVDKMNMKADSGLPKWLLKHFMNGFPSNWEALYDRWISESTGHPSRETESKSRGAVSRTKSESTINRSVRKPRQNSVKTSDSCTPAPSSSHINVSRSGRVIKPPLEYWKGGRVILDAHMNVTIHECYDTPSYKPKTTLSVKPSQKPSHVVQSCSEGKQRRLVIPLQRCSVAKSQPEEKSPVEERHSPDQWCGRATRSSQRSRATKRMSYKEPEKPSNPKKHIPETTKPSARDFSSKKVEPAPPESVRDGVTEKKKKKEVNRRRRRRATNESQLSEISRSDEDFKKDPETHTKPRQRKNKLSPPTAQSSRRKGKAVKAKTPFLEEHDADEWTEAELHKLQEAVSYFPKHTASYWAMVAAMVGTRSAEECYRQHTAAPTPPKRTKKTSKKPVEAAKQPDQLISARLGTFKRKQQVRHFLEAMPRDDVDDVFNSPRMQSKRFEMPSMCPSDQDFTMSEMQPLTPISSGFPEVKTPQCLHITPGMMGSPNRNNGDKYVHQLQKRMKKNQFNVCKQAPSLKSFTPTPSVQRKARRCGTTENDTFVVWEMFPELDAASADSREEEDFYFSDTN